MADPNDDPLWAKAQLDPSYLAGHGNLRNAIIAAALQYGDASSLFAQPQDGSPSLAAQYGIGQSDVAAAEQNPYSTLHGIGDTYTSAIHGDVQNLEARGLGQSGARDALAQHEMRAANEARYNAGQGLSKTLADIGGQNTGLITGAYQSLMSSAQNTPAVPPPAPAAVAPSSPSPVTPTSSFNYGLPPAAPINYGPQNGKITVPKPLTPKISLGHV